MNRIREGDMVRRISHEKDILFCVEKIIKENNKRIAILKGLTIRITTDSDVSDLEKVSFKEVRESLRSWENEIFEEDSLKKNKTRWGKVEKTGKILHLDGDRRYAEKSERYYRKNGLEAVVKNIKESEQARLLGNFIEKYKPDIVVITGHDGMIRKKVGYNDVNNYRNSRFFIEAVKKVRRYSDRIVVFARCLSKLL